MDLNLDICGWIGPQSKEFHSREIMEQMLASPNRAEKSFSIRDENKQNIAIAVDSNRGMIFDGNDVWLAITGNPKWESNTVFDSTNPQSSIEAIARQYKFDGRSILNRLSGTFVIVILEKKSRRALLAIDRLGVASLAYTIYDKSLIFSTSLQSIFRHPSVTPKIDNQGIFGYLYFHVVPSPATIYQDVWKLLPGECIEFVDGNIIRNFYWQPDYHDSTRTETELADELKSTLNRVVGEYAEGSNPTGTFLSGGLDSSTITGIFRKQSKRNTDAFTIGFQADGYDEMAFARASAKHFGVNLHEYYVTPDDVIKAIPLIAESYDEPFGNASAIPTHYCAKLAKEHGKSMLLAGDGGDEIFAGNERYAKQKVFEIYEFLPKAIKSVLEPCARNIPFLSKVASYINQANVPMPDRLQTYNFLHRTPIGQVLHGDFLKTINDQKPITDLREVYGRAPTNSLVKKMLFLDLKFTLADNDLRKVTGMSHVAGIEVGYPLLDDRIVDLSAKIPARLLMRRFELRSFFRRCYHEFLAPQTLSKSKHGFGLPFGLWLNTNARLKEFTQENLNQFKQRGILDPSYLDNLIRQHQAGHAEYYGVMIWILIILEQWLQTHQDV